MRPTLAAVALSAAVLAWPAAAGARHSDGHVGLYVARMEPTGNDAQRYSREGWGGGLQAVAPLPGRASVLAGVVGIEMVNLLSQKTEMRDLTTGLRVNQETSQHYGRFYLGSRLGLHGHEFFRPYLGSNVALTFYGISTDVVVPDDTDREREIRQNLSDEERFAFGYDVTLGADIDLMTRANLDGGVRFVKTFNVPQQLGAGSLPISPGYFQVYFGVGISFGALE